MKHKHNYIKVVSVFCIALVIVLLSSFVYQIANEVSAKEATPTTVIIPTTYLSSAPAVTEGTETNPKEESVDVSTPVVPYTEEDLDLLARLITAEMGASWVSDEIQLYVGSVVLNRMQHSLFPDTLYDVIYAKGQYSPTWTGAINNTPDERTIENARQLLEHGSVLPENVVFQANFPQGDGVYYEYYDEVLGTTTYFCYLSN